MCGDKGRLCPELERQTNKVARTLATFICCNVDCAQIALFKINSKRDWTRDTGVAGAGSARTSGESPRKSRETWLNSRRAHPQLQNSKLNCRLEEIGATSWPPLPSCRAALPPRDRYSFSFCLQYSFKPLCAWYKYNNLCL